MATLSSKIGKNLFSLQLALTNTTTVGKNSIRIMMNGDRLFSIYFNAARITAKNFWSRPLFLPTQSEKPLSLLVKPIGQQRRNLTIESARVANQETNINSLNTKIASTVNLVNFQSTAIPPVRPLRSASIHCNQPLLRSVFPDLIPHSYKNNSIAANQSLIISKFAVSSSLISSNLLHRPILFRSFNSLTSIPIINCSLFQTIFSKKNIISNSKRNTQTKKMSLPKVFFDLDDGAPIGRIVMEVRIFF